MRFEDVIGQEDVKQRLIHSFQEGRIAHALLFLGPEGCGNLALALAFAQYISCPNRTDRDSCGQCPPAESTNKPKPRMCSLHSPSSTNPKGAIRKPSAMTF